ncbi:hypothetical protein HYALB_00012422 [Hymenoscyphus albidus]|uniref:Uncharacterized protein n=1 Tax=Hymenoscyphus albidus TaxID=595503 RepID=A0A9N9LQ92_9HELO|nr:hypothetical protein HYALB_00012422 [Hymenoscyphus albidus]
MASMIKGWSEPRFTKQFRTPDSHSASKRANAEVYLTKTAWGKLRSIGRGGGGHHSEVRGVNIVFGEAVD